MEQSIKNTQSVRVKWYWKLFSKLDHEESEVDATTRIFAYIIDWVLGTMFTAFPTVFMYMSITKTPEANQNLLLFPSYYGLIAGALSILFAMIYYIYVPIRVNRGQTIGKKFMDIKVVNKDGSEVTFKTMLKRELLGKLILESCLIAAGSYLFQLLTIMTRIDLVIPLSCVSAVLCIFSLLIAARCESKRMLHDYVAKTKVVKVQK